MAKALVAYHGRQELKDHVLALLAEHREADRLVKGRYWELGKGCAVGCTLQSISVIEGVKVTHDNHALYEKYLGVPRVLARLEDALFERLPNGDSQRWPERFTRAIRPGSDLSMVWPKFLHDLLSDPAGGVQKCAAKNAGVGENVAKVIELYGRWIDGVKPSRKEWSAAASAAAYAAADASAASAADAYAAHAADASAASAADAYAAHAASAAASAADAAHAADADAAASAADAAASDAAASAAASAAERMRQADALIRLLEAA